MNKITQFQNALLAWFDHHGRKDLPWQQDINHYRVWVSEIMLQQTQVKTVIPYFMRFMQSFPTIEHLADAPIDEVLQHWAGLGYYARARNLHKTAKIIVHKFDGQFPSSHEIACTLPGIGKSTASAILSIVEQQSLAILDGNVKRVLTRVHAILGHPGEKKINAQLWRIAEEYTPKDRVHHYTQAIMDLGATLCTRSKPKCENCPMQRQCQANLKGETHLYPSKKPSKRNPIKQAHFLLLINGNGDILLEQRPDTGIWGGLFTLPSFANLEGIKQWLSENFSQSQIIPWPERKHIFTHFTLFFTPIQFNITNHDSIAISASQAWYTHAQIAKLGLPAPIKQVLNDYYKAYDNENDLLREIKTAS